MAKRRIGPFEIEGKLGVGGMGIVYLATYLKTGQKVALKVLSPTMSGNEKVLSRFEREMEILQKLRHKHIVRYFWGGKIKGQHLYAMEIMDGGSLEDQLKRKGRLSWEQTIDCAPPYLQRFGTRAQRGHYSPGLEACEFIPLQKRLFETGRFRHRPR